MIPQGSLAELPDRVAGSGFLITESPDRYEPQALPPEVADAVLAFRHTG